MDLGNSSGCRNFRRRLDDAKHVEPFRAEHSELLVLVV